MRGKAPEIPRLYDFAMPLEELRTPAGVIKYAKKYANAASTLWACWLQIHDGELMARIFAAKNTKRRGLQLLEVMREKPTHDVILTRHIWYTSMNWQCYFPDENEIIPNDWTGQMYTQRPNFWCTIINPEAVTKCERFRFCGWQPGIPLIDYLRIYLSRPGVEYFGKMRLIPRTSLLNQAEKDGNFRKWLRKLSPEQITAANHYGAIATLTAYKERNSDIEAVYKRQHEHRQLHAHLSYYAAPILKRYKAERVNEYFKTLTTREQHEYRDYLRACQYLKLDFKDTKIAFPKELKRMHDERIAQMDAQKIREDKEKRAKLWQDFENAAEALMRFEITAAGFLIKIPETPHDLKKEGAALHHCVGRMDYDVRMVEGKSFIAFLRSTADPATPLVTIEYDLKALKLRQVYGDHDSAPEPKAREFVDDWAQMVTEQLKAEEKAKENAKKKKEAAA